MDDYMLAGLESQDEYDAECAWIHRRRKRIAAAWQETEMEDIEDEGNEI